MKRSISRETEPEPEPKKARSSEFDILMDFADRIEIIPEPGDDLLNPVVRPLTEQSELVVFNGEVIHTRHHEPLQPRPKPPIEFRRAARYGSYKVFSDPKPKPPPPRPGTPEEPHFTVDSPVEEPKPKKKRKRTKQRSANQKNVPKNKKKSVDM